MARFTPRALLATVLAALALAFSGCQFAQYNIGNGASLEGQYDIVEWVQGGWRPVAITMNEVCGKRFDFMRWILAPYGYTGEFHDVADGCGDGRYGNAILHLGARHGWNAEPDGVVKFRFSPGSQENYPDGPPRPGHLRGGMGLGIIVPAHPNGLRMIVWTTHLQSNNPGVASFQAHEFLAQVNAHRSVSGRHMVIGGDFNLPPSHPMMRNHWCAQYFEAFACSSLSPTSGSHKYDYLFSTGRWGSSTRVPGRSDHLLLYSNSR